MGLSSCFSTESFEKTIKAGLPACRISGGLPIRRGRTVAQGSQKLLLRLTAAGTAPDFHRIPFTSIGTKVENFLKRII